LSYLTYKQTDKQPVRHVSKHNRIVLTNAMKYRIKTTTCNRKKPSL